MAEEIDKDKGGYDGSDLRAEGLANLRKDDVDEDKSKTITPHLADKEDKEALKNVTKYFKK